MVSVLVTVLSFEFPCFVVTVVSFDLAEYLIAISLHLRCTSSYFSLNVSCWLKVNFILSDFLHTTVRINIEPSSEVSFTSFHTTSNLVPKVPKFVVKLPFEVTEPLSTEVISTFSGLYSTVILNPIIPLLFFNSTGTETLAFFGAITSLADTT